MALWGCDQAVGRRFPGAGVHIVRLCLLARRLIVGRVMVAWVLANVAVKWETLTKRELPYFLQGMRRARARLLRDSLEDAGD